MIAIQVQLNFDPDLKGRADNYFEELDFSKECYWRALYRARLLFFDPIGGFLNQRNNLRNC
jgi:hypothetical protein